MGWRGGEKGREMGGEMGAERREGKGRKLFTGESIYYKIYTNYKKVTFHL